MWSGKILYHDSEETSFIWRSPWALRSWSLGCKEVLAINGTNLFSYWKGSVWNDQNIPHYKVTKGPSVQNPLVPSKKRFRNMIGQSCVCNCCCCSPLANQHPTKFLISIFCCNNKPLLCSQWVWWMWIVRYNQILELRGFTEHNPTELAIIGSTVCLLTAKSWSTGELCLIQDWEECVFFKVFIWKEINFLFGPKRKKLRRFFLRVLI